MLPPIEAGLVATNPRFGALYNDLCTNKLNEDGTSRLDAKAAKDRTVVEDDLHKLRIATAKRDIVQAGLHDLAYRADALPDELQELVAIAAAWLGGEIAPEDKEVASNEIEGFKEHARPIAHALSKHLQQTAADLATVLEPGADLTVDELPSKIQEIQSNIADLKSQLASSRLALASQIAELQSLHRKALETCIRTLEQSIHGSVARGTKAKADYLALVAEGMSKKLSMQHGQLVQGLYSVEMQEVLKARAEGLEEESRALKRSIREAEEKLEEYGRVRGMAAMVKEYGELVGEKERVEGEIARLEGR